MTLLMLKLSPFTCSMRSQTSQEWPRGHVCDLLLTELLPLGHKEFNHIHPGPQPLTLQGSLAQSHKPPWKPLTTCTHFLSLHSPWWFLAPCEGGYFLTGGPCSWFQFVAAVFPIQLHILGFPPGILGAPLVYSLPYGRIPGCQKIIY